MPLSDSLLSYDDIRATLDHALTAPNGLKITLATHGKAVHFRHRLYKFRILDRKNNKKIYPEGDPSHGTSPYDNLVATVEDNIILLTKTTMEGIEVEEI